MTEGMTMIERVARAMAIDAGKDPDAPAWVSFPGAVPSGVCWRDQYSSMARAAIEEMRDPTNEMMLAALDHFNPLDAWQAAISSALSETSGGEE
jgi:hypothetical protein